MEAGARRFAFGRAVDQNVLLLRRQIFKGSLKVDLVAVGGELDELNEVLRRGAGAEAAIEQRLGPVGDDFGGVEVVERAEAVAVGAGAKGGVEGEAARLEFGHVEAAVGAGHGGREQLLVAVVEADEDKAVGELQSLGDGLLKPLFDGRFCRRMYAGSAAHLCRRWNCRHGRSNVGFQQDAVDDGFDGVVLALVEEHGLGKVADLAVDAGAKSLLINLIQQILKLSLAASHNGRHDRDALAAA